MRKGRSSLPSSEICPQGGGHHPQGGYWLRTTLLSRWRRPGWRASSRGWPPQGCWLREERTGQRPRLLLPDSTAWEHTRLCRAIYYSSSSSFFFSQEAGNGQPEARFPCEDVKAPGRAQPHTSRIECAQPLPSLSLGTCLNLFVQQ